MDQLTSGVVRRRTVLLWMGVSAFHAALVATAGPLALDLAREPGAGFDELLVQSCAAAALLAGSVLWAATTDVALGVLRSPFPVPRRVGPLRSALLAVCGVAALTAATPASAAPTDGPDDRTAPGSLNGLPLPDRAVGGPPVDQAPAATTVRVRPGDSLWTIAARTLGSGASEADVAAYWQRLTDLNTTALGATPDLIHPGQQLDLPPR